MLYHPKQFGIVLKNARMDKKQLHVILATTEALLSSNKMPSES